MVLPENGVAASNVQKWVGELQLMPGRDRGAPFYIVVANIMLANGFMVADDLKGASTEDFAYDKVEGVLPAHIAFCSHVAATENRPVAGGTGSAVAAQAGSAQAEGIVQLLQEATGARKKKQLVHISIQVQLFARRMVSSPVFLLCVLLFARGQAEGYLVGSCTWLSVAEVRGMPVLCVSRVCRMCSTCLYATLAGQWLSTKLQPSCSKKRMRGLQHLSFSRI